MAHFSKRNRRTFEGSVDGIRQADPAVHVEGNASMKRADRVVHVHK